MANLGDIVDYTYATYRDHTRLAVDLTAAR